MTAEYDHVRHMGESNLSHMWLEDCTVWQVQAKEEVTLFISVETVWLGQP